MTHLLTIGDNIAHNKSPFIGSLGAFVICRDSRKVGLLGSGHVLAHANARKNDAIHCNITRLPSGLIQKNIATLSKCEHKYDAAVAWLSDGVTPNTKIPPFDFGFIGYREPQIGDILAKVGYETGLTRAKVTAIGHYPTRYGTQIRNMHAMYLEPLYGTNEKKVISQNGDCGAVWFDETTGEAVGLHFAGESYSAYGPIHGKACFMTSVLESLNVGLYLPSN